MRSAVVCCYVALCWATVAAGTSFPPPDPHDPHCNHGHAGPTPAPPVRPLPRARPPIANRSFHSPAVERRLTELVQNRTWRDPELATLLWNTLPNTLDTTVWSYPTAAHPNNVSFVSTGDQASMYLRDSQNQVMPYVRFAAEEPDGIGLFLRGILRKYVDSVLLDPYANSFDFTAGDRRCNPGAWLKDNTTKIDPTTGARVDGMQLGVHQRKWEMDSLASVLKLSRLYWEATSDPRPFGPRWRQAVALIVSTYRAMQQPLDPVNFTSVNYTFQTLTHEPKDTSAHGIGRNHRWTGMIRTLFLPSDDSPRLPYFVPANAFAVTELRGVAKLLRGLSPSGTIVSQDDEALAQEAEELAAEVDRGIRDWGIVTHSSGARVYAMEVDGYGNYFFGDDANVPSLLALPFYGYVAAADRTYQATRALLLSNKTNPYFYGCGSTADGCGFLGGIGSEDASGNAGLGRVWPLSLCTRLLTVAGNSAEADAERLAILETLRESSGGTGLMHESYWFQDPSVYTRFWFAMANSYAGEALLSLAENHPHLLFTDV